MLLSVRGQAHSLVQAVVRRQAMTEASGNAKAEAVIIAGDFNSLPGSVCTFRHNMHVHHYAQPPQPLPRALDYVVVQQRYTCLVL
jgi:hypothetical protein